jgi:hypothetical protein
VDEDVVVVELVNKVAAVIVFELVDEDAVVVVIVVELVDEDVVVSVNLIK